MQINRAHFWTRLVTLCAILLPAFPALAGNVAYTYDALDRLTGAVDGDGTVIEYSYDAAGNRTSHIVQAAANLTLTFAMAGTGSGTVGGGGAYAAGDPVTLTATADVGSTFAGWGPSPCAASFAMPGADLTCTATFALNSYTVTALAGTNGRISPASQTVGHGATTAFTVTPNTGYIGTATGCGGTLNGTTYTTGPITGPCTVTASFTPAYNLTLTKAGTGSGTVTGIGINCGSDCTEPYASGTAVTLTASPANGSNFSGWGGACTGTGACTVTMSAAKSVTANFSIKTYAITATANPVAGGTVTCTPNPVSHGGGSTCTATPKTGYSFTAFSGACTGATCALTNVTEAKAVTGNFSPKTYPITTTASPAAGGTVACTVNPVSHGGSSTCTATPNTGYTFSAFSGACTGASCVLTNVTAAKSVTATFRAKTYSITATANPVAGGTVRCTPNPVSHGGGSACTATPRVGYNFSGFSGACTGATCALTNVTEAKAVTGNFSLKTYPITTTASPVAGGTVACTANPVPHGGSSTCTATPNAGYSFSAFSGACIGASCRLTNVTAAKSVTASFRLKTYPITATASPAVGGTVRCTPNPVPHGGGSTCTATPRVGYRFTGFSGACTGASCALTNVTSAQSVTAVFAR